MSVTASLDLLLTDGVIDEVIGQLKTGKEAEVWLVRRVEEILAAKVYKERHHRSFRNNAAYREGRQVRNSRTQRAMDKGSRFGQAATEDAWKSTEADALYKLHSAGVRVPQPSIFYEGVLVMEVVVDPEGYPAPRLIDAPILPEQARALYEDLRRETIKMLCAEIIHGDLSPFNVLLAWNGPTLIDFPQIVSAAHNNRAEWFFKRDLDNIRRFFAGVDPSLHGQRSDADEIWRAYVRRELTPDFVPTGKVQAAQEQGPARGPREHRGGPRGPGRSESGHGARGPREGHRPGGPPSRAETSYRGERTAGGTPGRAEGHARGGSSGGRGHRNQGGHAGHGGSTGHGGQGAGGRGQGHGRRRPPSAGPVVSYRGEVVRAEPPGAPSISGHSSATSERPPAAQPSAQPREGGKPGGGPRHRRHRGRR